MFSQLNLAPMVILAATILPMCQFRHLYISIEGIGEFFLAPMFIPAAVILSCVNSDISYISTKDIGDIFQTDLEIVSTQECFIDLAFRGSSNF